MDNRENKVQVSHLTKQFGDLLVLNDISFNVKKGEFLCIVGPTGCGKTTFLNSLTKLYQPTKGDPHQRRGRRLKKAQHRLHFPGILHYALADRRRKCPLRPGHQAH